MSGNSNLPPGQREIDALPRFGLTKFAYRFPKEIEVINLSLGGDAEECVFRNANFTGLKRVHQVCDFHCVTTWSKLGLNWSGFRFADFYEKRVLPKLIAQHTVKYAVVQGQDGYRTCMLLKDLLAHDVLLADRLDDKPLPLSHGAPLRLVAPAHYGYKSVKHISRMEFWTDEPDYSRAAFRFMDHPRARVELEERGLVFPGWLLRRVYRPLITPTVRRFRKALVDYDSDVRKENAN